VRAASIDPLHVALYQYPVAVVIVAEIVQVRDFTLGRVHRQTTNDGICDTRAVVIECVVNHVVQGNKQFRQVCG
jgi:hypothetical protein